MTSYPNGLTEGGGMQEGCGMGRGEEEGVVVGGGGWSGSTMSGASSKETERTEKSLLLTP